MPNVKVMDPVEDISKYLYLTLEEGVNQAVESANMRNSKSWKYPTGFMLGKIRYPYGGSQEIPTPPQ